MNEYICEVFKYLKKPDFFGGIIASIIAALIFYLIFNYLPERNRRKNVQHQITFNVDKILILILGIIEVVNNSKVKQSEIWAHKIINFEEHLKDVHIDDKLKGRFTPGPDGRNMTVGSLVKRQIIEVQNLINNLLRFTYHLDTRLLNLIAEIDNNVFWEKWLNVYENYRQPVFLNGQTIIPPVATLSANFPKDLENLYESYKLLDKYLLNNFPKDTVVIRRKEVIKVNTEKRSSYVKMV